MRYDLRTAPGFNDAIMIDHVTSDDVIGDVILFTLNVDDEYGNATFAILRDSDGTPTIYSVEAGAPAYTDDLWYVVTHPDAFATLPDDVLDLANRLF